MNAPGTARATRRSVSSTDQESASEEFLRLHERLLAYVQGQFRDGVVDHEAICQDAWQELYAYRAEHGPDSVRDPEQFLRTVAWRRSANVKRNKRATPTDPAAPLITELADRSPTTEDRVAAALSEDACADLLASLTDEERRVIKLRCQWGWSPGDVARQLGINRKRYELIMQRAGGKVSERMTAKGAPGWERARRALAAAVVGGFATAAQKARAEQLMRSDPHFRDLLAQHQSTLHNLAGLVPADLALSEGHRTSVLDHLATLADHATTKARETAFGFLHRTPVGEDAATATHAAITSGGARGAGAAAIAKALAICGATAAGGAACVAGGVIPDPGLHLPGHAKPAKQVSANPAPPVASEAQPAAGSVGGVHEKPSVGGGPPDRSTADRSASEPAETAPPPPAQEFAPVGAPAGPAPAATPPSRSSPASSGGAVRPKGTAGATGEFGP